MKNNSLPRGNRPIFSKELSLAIKGVAILMMLAHHCFAFPDYWLDDFSVGAIPTAVCDSFKICVALFAFITGYSSFVTKERKYKDVLGKALCFLWQYWLQLFLIFLPVACIHFSFSTKRILYNLIALHDNIILFAWYVFFHILVMLTFPFVKRLLGKRLWLDLPIIVIGGYCVTAILYFLPVQGPLASMLLDCSIYYPVVGMGYLCARYGILDRIANRLHILGAIGIITLVLLLRTWFSVIKGFSFDTFYTPLFIVSLCVILKKIQFLQKILMFLGRNSFHMWLFHSIFFSAYTRDIMQPSVSWINIPIIRYLLVLFFSLAAAVLLEKLWNVCAFPAKWLRKKFSGK